MERVNSEAEIWLNMIGGRRRRPNIVKDIIHTFATFVSLLFNCCLHCEMSSLPFINYNALGAHWLQFYYPKKLGLCYFLHQFYLHKLGGSVQVICILTKQKLDLILD